MDPQYIKLFKNKNFLKLWSSQIASQVTISMVNFALIARIFEQTGSSVAVSFLWITYGLPALMIGPIVGPLIDLASKRRILITTNVLQAIAIFSYHLVKQKLFPLYTIVFAYSFLDQFYLPAEAVSIPSLVPRSQLALANGLYSLTFQVSVLSGFALAGPLMAFLGSDVPFYLGSLLLLLAAWSVYKLPRKEPDRRPRSFGLYWKDLTYGYHYVRHQPFIYLPILFIMAFQTGFSIVAAVFPSYVSDVLGLAVRDASWVLVIPGGLGALLGAIRLIPYLQARMRKRQIIELGLGCGAFALLAFGALVPLLGAPFRSVLASLAAFLAGVAGILLVVPANTLIQEKTPAALRGRVFGSLTFLLTIAMVAPTLMAATISDVIGTQTMAVLLGVFTASFLLVSRLKGDELLKNVSEGTEGSNL